MTVRKLFRVQIEHEVPIGTYAGKERITSSFYDIMARAETPVEAMRVARDCHQEEAGGGARRAPNVPLKVLQAARAGRLRPGLRSRADPCRVQADAEVRCQNS